MECICCKGPATGKYGAWDVCEECYRSGKLRVFLDTNPEFKEIPNS